MIREPLVEMNKHVEPDIADAADRKEPPPALLYEMVRSFVSMAATLNLSQSVRELNSTRQTVRRHITNLEAAMGLKLFEVDERRYRLTPEGEEALPEAADFLGRGAAWLNGQINRVGHLQRLKARVGEWEFFQEQQPVGLIWDDTSILLRETLRAWCISGGQIENPNFAHVRPFLIVYRQTELGWICVEFGRKSVYVNWFGQEYAQSSIGRTLGQMPAGQAFSNLLNEAFEEVQATQTARLDHVMTRMPRPDPERLVPVAYQRLMLTGFFPDGSPAVMSLIQPVENVRISSMDPAQSSALEPVEPSEFGREDARFEIF